MLDWRQKKKPCLIGRNLQFNCMCFGPRLLGRPNTARPKAYEEEDKLSHVFALLRQSRPCSSRRRHSSCEISRQRCHGFSSRLLKPSCSLPSRLSRRHRHRLLIPFLFLASTYVHPRGGAVRRITRRRQGRRRGSGGWSRCGRSAAAASTTGSTPTPDGPSTQLVPPCPLSLTHSLLLAGCPRRLLFLNGDCDMVMQGSGERLQG